MKIDLTEKETVIVVGFIDSLLKLHYENKIAKNEQVGGILMAALGAAGPSIAEWLQEYGRLKGKENVEKARSKGQQG